MFGEMDDFFKYIKLTYVDADHYTIGKKGMFLYDKNDNLIESIGEDQLRNFWLDYNSERLSVESFYDQMITKAIIGE